MNNDKVAQAEEIAKEHGAIFVKAVYKTLMTKANVVVKIPKAGDPYLRKMSNHRILVPSDESLNGFYVIDVRTQKGQGYFRRGDFIQRKMLTRNFFIAPESRGKKIIATIEVVEKVDLFRDGQKTLILNICEMTQNGSPLIPCWRIKLGAEKVDGAADQSIIPETDKVVRFERI